jgi:hypothetical protein
MVRKNGHARSDDSEGRNWWGRKLRMRRGCAPKLAHWLRRMRCIVAHRNTIIFGKQIVWN